MTTSQPTDKSKGCKLEELDKSGPAPNKVVLAGPDHAIVSEAKVLNIVVAGKNPEALRFALENGTLGIMREPNSGCWDTCTIYVGMPVPRSLTVAGSGTLEAAQAADAELSVAGSGTLEVAALTGDTKLTISGSGSIKAARVAAGKCGVTISGSGSIHAAGQADVLNLTISGSGRANLGELSAAGAEVSIAGSGKAEFASDGAVVARIMGSGTVTVSGHANCTVHKSGSGTLHCREGTITRAA